LALELAPTVPLDMFLTLLAPVFQSSSAPKTALPVTLKAESVKVVQLVTPPTQLEIAKSKFLVVNIVLMIRVTRYLGSALSARQAIIQLLPGAVHQMLTAVANAMLDPVIISVVHALCAILDLQLIWPGFVLLRNSVTRIALLSLVLAII